MVCPHCQAPIEDTAKRCPACGRSLLVAVAGDAVATAPVGRLRAWWSAEWRAMLAWTGRASPWPRWPLVLFMLYLAWTTSFAAGKEGIFWGINLGIHEAGHLLTSWAPNIVCAAAGSGLQCLVPIVALVILRKQDDWGGVAFCLAWLGTNFNYVSWYMYDAEEMRAQLLTVGGGGRPVPKEQMHDWHNIFSQLGLLGASDFIATLVLLLGVVCLWGAVALGGYQLWRMHRR